MMVGKRFSGSTCYLRFTQYQLEAIQDIKWSTWMILSRPYLLVFFCLQKFMRFLESQLQIILLQFSLGFHYFCKLFTLWSLLSLTQISAIQGYILHAVFFRIKLKCNICPNSALLKADCKGAGVMIEALGENWRRKLMVELELAKNLFTLRLVRHCWSDLAYFGHCTSPGTLGYFWFFSEREQEKKLNRAKIEKYKRR